MTEDYPIGGQPGGSQASGGEVIVSWTRKVTVRGTHVTGHLKAQEMHLEVTAVTATISSALEADMWPFLANEVVAGGGASGTYHFPQNRETMAGPGELSSSQAGPCNCCCEKSVITVVFLWAPQC